MALALLKELANSTIKVQSVYGSSDAEHDFVLCMLSPVVLCEFIV